MAKTGKSADPTRPIVASTRPLMASKRPIVASTRPLMASKRPIVASTRPLMASKRPIVASRGAPHLPELVVSQPVPLTYEVVLTWHPACHTTKAPNPGLLPNRLLNSGQHTDHGPVDRFHRAVVKPFVERLIVHRMNDGGAGDVERRLADAELLQTGIETCAQRPFVGSAACDVQQMEEHRLHRRRRDLFRPTAIPGHHFIERNNRAHSRGEGGGVEGELVHAKLAAADGDGGAERTGNGDVEQQKGIVKEKLYEGRDIARCEVPGVIDHGYVDADDVLLGCQRSPAGPDPNNALRRRVSTLLQRGGRTAPKLFGGARVPRMPRNLGGESVFVHIHSLRAENRTARMSAGISPAHRSSRRGLASAGVVESHPCLYESWRLRPRRADHDADQPEARRVLVDRHRLMFAMRALENQFAATRAEALHQDHVVHGTDDDSTDCFGRGSGAMHVQEISRKDVRACHRLALDGEDRVGMQFLVSRRDAFPRHFEGIGIELDAGARGDGMNRYVPSAPP